MIELSNNSKMVYWTHKDQMYNKIGKIHGYIYTTGSVDPIEGKYIITRLE